MNKIFFILFSSGFMLTGCNNAGEKQSDEKTAKADTLLEQVMEGHNVGMAKMNRLSKLQKETLRLADSIAQLPEKAQKAAVPYKSELDSLLSGLQKAEYEMNKWMEEFNYDSAKQDAEKRIQYLADEKIKVEQVKKSILETLEKADSVLKKF